jgi:hypothetical protein
MELWGEDTRVAGYAVVTMMLILWLLFGVWQRFLDSFALVCFSLDFYISDHKVRSRPRKPPFYFLLGTNTLICHVTSPHFLKYPIHLQ